MKFLTGWRSCRLLKPEESQQHPGAKPLIREREGWRLAEQVCLLPGPRLQHPGPLASKSGRGHFPWLPLSPEAWLSSDRDATTLGCPCRAGPATPELAVSFRPLPQRGPLPRPLPAKPHCPNGEAETQGGTGLQGPLGRGVPPQASVQGFWGTSPAHRPPDAWQGLQAADAQGPAISAPADPKVRRQWPTFLCPARAALDPLPPPGHRCRELRSAGGAGLLRPVHSWGD